MRTITRWKTGFQFDSQFRENHIISDDVTVSGLQDSGFSPKAMLLAALAGCTGIDLISILDKMKAPYQSITIETEAALTTEYPSVFTEINISYVVQIPADYEDRVRRAIDLSLNKYCGVAAMLRKQCPIYSKVAIG